MAALRIFNIFRDRSAVRSAYDESEPPVRRAPLFARWSPSSKGKPAAHWEG